MSASFLAPGRLREEHIGEDTSRTFYGFDERVVIDGRSWQLDRRRATWQEIDTVFDSKPANAINVIIGPLPLPFEPIEDDAGLQGEGGCVLSTEVPGAQGGATVSIRIDPVLGRIVVWPFEQDQDPTPGGATRRSVLIEYETPSADEFQPPAVFDTVPVS